MPIRVKIDEDLPIEVGERMRIAGHDVRTVLAEGLGGVPDEVLWPRVQDEGRWLFTADKGFADVRTRPPGTHGGVVLFRLPRESRAGYIELADTLVNTVDLAALSGAIVVVAPGAVRVHRP